MLKRFVAMRAYLDCRSYWHVSGSYWVVAPLVDIEQYEQPRKNLKYTVNNAYFTSGLKKRVEMKDELLRQALLDHSMMVRASELRKAATNAIERNCVRLCL